MCVHVRVHLRYTKCIVCNVHTCIHDIVLKTCTRTCVPNVPDTVQDAVNTCIHVHIPNVHDTIQDAVNRCTLPYIHVHVYLMYMILYKIQLIHVHYRIYMYTYLMYLILYRMHVHTPYIHVHEDM